MAMPYRRTENVVRRLAAREQAILDAAAALASEGGMAAVQIAAVAERAGIAAGTVYRYFPSKIDLVAALIGALAERELTVMRAAGDGAPGPLSALAATIATFAARAIHARQLLWAITGEAVEPELDGLRLAVRRSLGGELAARINAASGAGHLLDLDARIAAPAVIGALLEGLIGPLAPASGEETAAREMVQTATLLALRALGVVDARARGLVAQIALPVRQAS
jgi:AcrR family transcriptional regulator